MDGIASIFRPLFAFEDGDGWHPGIGDPTFIGWFTVVAYVIAAVLCWRAASHNPHASRRIRWFWLTLSAVLGFLAVNKQLDLQTALTFAGRSLAKSQGWYEHRRLLQGIFILLIALGGIGLTAWLLWIFRRDLPILWQPLLGVGFLITFIIIRAASFHHIDQFLMHGPAEIRMNWILELGGIAAIAYPAWRASRRSPETGFIWISRERPLR